MSSCCLIHQLPQCPKRHQELTLRAWADRSSLKISRGGNIQQLPNNCWQLGESQAAARDISAPPHGQIGTPNEWLLGYAAHSYAITSDHTALGYTAHQRTCVLALHLIWDCAWMSKAAMKFGWIICEAYVTLVIAGWLRSCTWAMRFRCWKSLLTLAL